MNWAVDAAGVGKRYALGEREQYGALRDVISETVRRPFTRTRPSTSRRSHRWALEDVNVQFAPGEVVGLIGHNGAGKSTLLKLISSITRPTTGQVSVRGRVGTLLEVGSGFHPELTGAENIYLNGAILGMRRNEIRDSFDQIVEFSGVSTYLDTPVKRYSTGMFMRLAFAVAAHLDTEVLLVDEVLAVGDAEFQRKCMGRMRELAEGEGRTVIFVSHSDAAIRRLCPRSVWLHDGHVRLDGPSDRVLEAYLEERFRHGRLGSRIDVTTLQRSGSGEVRFAEVTLDVPGRDDPPALRPGDPLRIRTVIEADTAVTCGNVSFYLSTLGGEKLVSGGTAVDGEVVELAPGLHEIEIVIDAVPLNPGRYAGSLWLARPTGARKKFGLYDHLEGFVDVVVVEELEAAPPEGLVQTESTTTFHTGSRRPA